MQRFRAPRRRFRTGDQTGAVSGEQIGVLVLVAAMVGLLVRAGVPALVADWGSYAVCSLFSADECDRPSTVELVQPAVPAGGLTDEDFLPTVCVVSQQRDEAGYRLSLKFIEFGEEFGFVRQELSDGRVRLTVVDAASLAASIDGGDRIIDLGKLGSDEKGALRLGASIGLDFEYGDTWEMTAAEEEAFREHLDQYRMQQMQLRQGEAGGWAYFWNWVFGNHVDAPREPDVSFSRITLEADIGGQIGMRSPYGQDGEGQATYLDPNIGAALTLDGSADVLRETNNRTGEVSYSYQLRGRVTGGADLAVGGGEGSVSSSGVVKMTYDRDGVLTGLELVTSRHGGFEGSLGLSNPLPGTYDPSVSGSRNESRVVISRTTLDLSDARHRAVVEDALQGNLDRYGTAFRLAREHMAPDRPAPDDPLAQLLYEHGRTSELVYNDVTDGQQFGLTVSAAWKLGFTAYLSSTDRSVDEANFLGAPGPDGIRPRLPDTGCTR